jgi:hypothetical protein
LKRFYGDKKALKNDITPKNRMKMPRRRKPERTFKYVRIYDDKKASLYA